MLKRLPLISKNVIFAIRVMLISGFLFGQWRRLRG